MLRVVFALAVLFTGVAQAETYSTRSGAVDITPVVEDLDQPWSVAFLPDGALLITEIDGRLLLIEGDRRREVSGVPEVRESGQGGLLDVVPDPDFAASNVIYLSYSEPVGSFSARTAVARATLNQLSARLDDVQVILRQDPERRGGRHFGSRIVPDGKGHLFVTLGERGDDRMAQDTDTLLGKVVRINPDGTIPDGNPFAAGGGRPEIWSWGHRNPQGAALDELGRLWTVAHGARGGDEVNRPEAGKNYGWPVISYGTEYSGAKIGEGTHKEGMEQPVWYWDPSIAPSGMAIYSGRLRPEWSGDIFVGSLKFDFISRLDRDGDRITGEEQLFKGEFGRIRDVREGPDGAIWFLSEGDGALYRMVPAE